MPDTDLVHPHDSPSSTSDQLTITIVEDPLRVRHGFPISSAYVETFWLSRLGPSAVCLLRLFDRLCRHQPNQQVTLSVSDLGAVIGTPGGVSKNSVIMTRIDRLARFGAARWATAGHTQLTVWSHLDAVPLRLQYGWPDWLLDAHSRAVADRNGR